MGIGPVFVEKGNLPERLKRAAEQAAQGHFPPSELLREALDAMTRLQSANQVAGETPYVRRLDRALKRYEAGQPPPSDVIQEAARVIHALSTLAEIRQSLGTVREG